MTTPVLSSHRAMRACLLLLPALGACQADVADPDIDLRDGITPSVPLDPDPPTPAVPGPGDDIDAVVPTDPDLLAYAQSVLASGDTPVLSFLNEQDFDGTIVRFENEADQWDPALVERVRAFDGSPIDPATAKYTAAYYVTSQRALRQPRDPHEGIEMFQFTARDPSSGELLGVYVPPARAHIDASDPVYEAVEQQAIPVADLSWPADMPAIHLPDLIDCDAEHIVNAATQETEHDAVVRSWGIAHHHTWRAWQMMTILEALWPHAGNKWQTGWVEEDGPFNWSMREWFGEYGSDYYQAVDTEIRQLWQRMRTGVYDGLSLHLKCEKLYHTGNVCLSTNAVAHHWVKGYVNVCFEWYDWHQNYFDDRSISHRRAFILLHELMHHSYVTIGDDNAKAVIDTHNHGHGNNCLNDVSTDNFTHYYDRIEHLSATGACKHKKKNLRSPSSYAFFVAKLGAAIWDGDLKSFPPNDGMQPGIGDGCDAYEDIENDIECLPNETCAWPLVIPELCITANAQNEGP